MKTTIVDKAPVRFVITESPSDDNMQLHVNELCKLKVRHVARASEPTYSTQALASAGITCHDFLFEDGTIPPEDVRRRWLKLVEDCFVSSSSTGNRSSTTTGATAAARATGLLKENERISVHCVAGLGRAPVLVAIALIEYADMTPLESIQFIRQKRQGAFNTVQLKWLQGYKKKSVSHSSSGMCTIL